MGSMNYRVTTVADYTVTWDDDAVEEGWVPDDDYLHDAIMDNYDTVDLEFTTEHPLFDEDGDETDETLSVTLNADAIREVEVVALD